MILKSSKKNTIKLFTGITGVIWIIIGIYMAFGAKDIIKGFIISTAISLFIFIIFFLCAIAADTTADDKYIYIRNLNKYEKISYDEIEMVETYMKPTGKSIVPVMRITKTDGKLITQGIAMEQTEVLMTIFKEHNIKVNEGKKD
jgi:hypothetical protein